MSCSPKLCGYLAYHNNIGRRMTWLIHYIHPARFTLAKHHSLSLWAMLSSNKCVSVFSTVKIRLDFYPCAVLYVIKACVLVIIANANTSVHVVMIGIYWDLQKKMVICSEQKAMVWRITGLFFAMTTTFLFKIPKYYSPISCTGRMTGLLFYSDDNNMLMIVDSSRLIQNVTHPSARLSARQTGVNDSFSPFPHMTSSATQFCPH